MNAPEKAKAKRKQKSEKQHIKKKKKGEKDDKMEGTRNIPSLKSPSSLGFSTSPFNVSTAAVILSVAILLASSNNCSAFKTGALEVMFETAVSTNPSFCFSGSVFIVAGSVFNASIMSSMRALINMRRKRKEREKGKEKKLI